MPPFRFIETGRLEKKTSKKPFYLANLPNSCYCRDSWIHIEASALLLWTVIGTDRWVYSIYLHAEFCLCQKIVTTKHFRLRTPSLTVHISKRAGRIVVKQQLSDGQFIKLSNRFYRIEIRPLEAKIFAKVGFVWAKIARFGTFLIPTPTWNSGTDHRLSAVCWK